MAYTNVETLDDALAALNGARHAFRPEFFDISYEDGAVQIGCTAYATKEIWSATTVTGRAICTINGALVADPSLRLIEDHKGDWVAIRTA